MTRTWLTTTRVACTMLAACLFLSACGKKAPLRPPSDDRPKEQQIASLRAN